jgi:peptidoglycan/LPS O-acetylase OafA/YrhL
MQNEKSGHIHFGFLDSVRGLAALFVVIGHSFNTPSLSSKCGMNDIFWTIHELTTPCALSVFFLLSSFLLTFRLHSDLQKALSLKDLSLTICKYLVRRICRIYLVFFIYCTIFTVLPLGEIQNVPKLSIPHRY